MSSTLSDVQRCVAENLKRIRGTMAESCLRSNRHPEDVSLVVVTKTVGIDVIRHLLDLGERDLGESRVQDLTQRAAMVEEGFSRRNLGGQSVSFQRPRWHLVGHLQRNKVRAVLRWTEMIHAVDSLRLGEEIDACGARLDQKVNILLQVNAADESGKFGVAIGAALHLAEQFASMSNLVVRGVMCMAPLHANAPRLQAVFGRTRELFEEMRARTLPGGGFDTLSMGMSDDYEIAVECGATLVRIGRAAFRGLGGQEDGDGADSADVTSDSTTSTGR